MYLSSPEPSHVKLAIAGPFAEVLGESLIAELRLQSALETAGRLNGKDGAIGLPCWEVSLRQSRSGSGLQAAATAFEDLEDTLGVPLEIRQLHGVLLWNRGEGILLTMGGTPIGRRRWDRCSGKIHDAAERVRSEPKKRMESRFGATGCIRLGEGAEARKAVLASLGLSCCEEVLHLFEYETAGCPPWPLPSDEENGQGRWLTGLRLEMDRHPEWRALDVRLAKSWGHGGANPEVAAVRLKRQSEPFVAEYHGWGHETMEPAGWLLWTMQPGMLWPLWGQPVPVP